MGEPIILDGGNRMITIKLPSSFQKGTPEGNFSVFSVTPKETEPFKTILVTDIVTGAKLFNLPINEKKWKIEIK